MFSSAGRCSAETLTKDRRSERTASWNAISFRSREGTNLVFSSVWRCSAETPTKECGMEAERMEEAFQHAAGAAYSALFGSALGGAQRGWQRTMRSLDATGERRYFSSFSGGDDAGVLECREVLTRDT